MDKKCSCAIKHKILYNDAMSFFCQKRVNLTINKIYKSSTDMYSLCMKCGTRIKEKCPKKFIKKRLPKKIVLDLDQTLIVSTSNKELAGDEWDFAFKYLTYKYYVKKRPFLEEFIDFVLKNYKQIIINTASDELYGREVIKNLGIPLNRIKYIKTRKDAELKRFIDFEKHYIKKENNALIIDDKPYVYEGTNNFFYHIPAYNGQANDDELLKFIQNIKEYGQINYNPVIAKKITLVFFGRELSFELFNIPFNILEKIITIKILTQKQRINHYRHYADFIPFYEYMNGYGRLCIGDVSYSNYCKIISMITPYINYPYTLQTKIEFKKGILKNG